MKHIIGDEILKKSSPTGKNNWKPIPENVYEGVESEFLLIFTAERLTSISRRVMTFAHAPKYDVFRPRAVHSTIFFTLAPIYDLLSLSRRYNTIK